MCSDIHAQPSLPPSLLCPTVSQPPTGLHHRDCAINYYCAAHAEMVL